MSLLTFAVTMTKHPQIYLNQMFVQNEKCNTIMLYFIVLLNYYSVALYGVLISYVATNNIH